MSTNPDDEIRAILAKVQSVDTGCQRKLDTREIDRVLLEEHRARTTARPKPQHGVLPPEKRVPKANRGGRPRTTPAATLGQQLKAEMSIAAAKKRQRQAAPAPAPHGTSKANMMRNLATAAFKLAGVRTRKKRSDARITSRSSQKP